MHFQTSAKLNQGVEDMFFALAQKMLQVHEDKELQTNSLTRQNSQKRNVVVVDDETELTATKSCCRSS